MFCFFLNFYFNEKLIFRYDQQTFEAIVPDNGKKIAIVDISLMRDDPQHWASAYDYRIIENVVRTKYHTNEELNKKMAELENSRFKIANLESGDNDVSMAFHSLKVTKEIGSPEETKLHILILSSLFNSSPLGREMVMNLARHVLEGYTGQEPSMVKLLENAVLHFVPIMDGFNLVNQQFVAK